MIVDERALLAAIHVATRKPGLRQAIEAKWNSLRAEGQSNGLDPANLASDLEVLGGLLR